MGVRQRQRGERPTESASAPDYVLVGGSSEYVRLRFQVDAEGALFGQGSSAWFYEGAGGATALITDGADEADGPYFYFGEDLLMFGDGIDPTLFDFVTTRDN